MQWGWASGRLVPKAVVLSHIENRSPVCYFSLCGTHTSPAREATELLASFHLDWDPGVLILTGKHMEQIKLCFCSLTCETL